jgi:hypothetical protein
MDQRRRSDDIYTIPYIREEIGTNNQTVAQTHQLGGETPLIYRFVKTKTNAAWKQTSCAEHSRKSEE